MMIQAGVLKGHGFSRAVSIAKSFAALAAEGKVDPLNQSLLKALS